MNCAASNVYSSIGVVTMTDSASSMAYGRMLHEAVMHLGDRLERLGEEVRGIDSRVTELTATVQRHTHRAEDALAPPPAASRSAVKGPASWGSSLAKRVAILEVGQKTVAAGARRALRRAIAAQRAAQDAAAALPLMSTPQMQARAVQEPIISGLDEQVSILKTHLHHGVQLASHSDFWAMFTADACTSQPRSCPASSPGVSRFSPPLGGCSVSEASPQATSLTSCDGAMESRHSRGSGAQGGVHGRGFTSPGRRAPQPSPSSPSLVELMEEAVEEAEMEQLQKVEAASRR
eukprot:TRINITY_DN27486_c0_g1_i2.p1 TRINITY_DN27486_c0_g1~~TRINITY_DN27486_c0_g1_i2.p1  ORF type:complete len:291 (-),score=64.42 TRINITY_DN27486_c0_g1_i2:75-947(-)